MVRRVPSFWGFGNFSGGELSHFKGRYPETSWSCESFFTLTKTMIFWPHQKWMMLKMRSNPFSCGSCCSPWFQSSWETFPSKTPENPTKENNSSQLWKRCAHIFLEQLRSSRVTWNFWRERPLRVPRLHDFAWILVGSKGCLYETLEFRRGLSFFRQAIGKNTESLLRYP